MSGAAGRNKCPRHGVGAAPRARREASGCGDSRGGEPPAPASALQISLHLTNGVFIFFSEVSLVVWRESTR